ncbi:MAG: fumarylacetoacetate hydrolase family protein [Ilumatobacteraceae bacterium]
MPEYRRILLDGYPDQHSHVRATASSPVTAGGSPSPTPVHLPPVEPTKIVCVHLNYTSRVAEFMTTLPPAPTYFHKPVTALNSHGADVVRPNGCKWLNYEGEIAIVIGRTCRNVAPADAGDYIAGYSVANDYGLHDFRDTDAGSMLRVKGSDTLCPIGPGVVDRLGLPRQADPHARQRRGAPGRQHRRDGVGHALPRRRHRPHDHARPRRRAAVGHARQLAPVQPGDEVTVEVEGLGALTNRIVTGPTAIRTDVGAQPSESEEVRSTALGGDWEHRGERAPEGPGASHYQSQVDWARDLDERAGVHDGRRSAWRRRSRCGRRSAWRRRRAGAGRSTLDREAALVSDAGRHRRRCRQS